MKNVLVLLAVSVSVILLMLSLFPLSLASKANQRPSARQPSPVTSQPSAEMSATIKIYIHGLPKDLTEREFVNQSPKAYLTAATPDTLRFTKTNLTWSDFFKTLPISVSAECLVSEMNEEFCTTSESKLYLFKNGREAPELLSQTIQPGDKILITYGNLTDAELNYQLSQLK